MKVSNEGIYFLACHEGVVPGPYLDSVGVWTYGVGHAETSGLDPNPRTMPRGMPADMDAELRKVFALFAKDVEIYAAAVRRAVKVPMAQHEFDAAVSFHFNTGAIGKATWVKKWNSGDKKEARRQMMNWKKPASIIPRRQAERDLWADGNYGAKKVNVWGVSDAGKVQWGRPVQSLTKAQVLALMDTPNTVAQRPKPRPVAPTPPAAPTYPPAGRSGGVFATLGAFLRSISKWKGGDA